MILGWRGAESSWGEATAETGFLAHSLNLKLLNNVPG